MLPAPDGLEAKVQQRLEEILANKTVGYIHWTVYETEAIVYIQELGYSYNKAKIWGPRFVTNWFDKCRADLHSF